MNSAVHEIAQGNILGNLVTFGMADSGQLLMEYLFHIVILEGKLEIVIFSPIIKCHGDFYIIYFHIVTAAADHEKAEDYYFLMWMPKKSRCHWVEVYTLFYENNSISRFKIGQDQCDFWLISP